MVTTFTLPVRAGTDMQTQHTEETEKSRPKKPGLFALTWNYEN
jgi:hypothetical protein